MSLQKAFDRFLPQIETELQEIVRLPHPRLGTYYGMMRYHLGWVDRDLRPHEARSGKRLRPVLCLLCCQAAGGDPLEALPAAAAVELVHNFSLVHDDIQDASHFRRGRRAVWDLWGAPHAINVGDGLFTLARLALHRLAARGVALERIQAATLALDRACLALCEGQYFDMTFEDQLDVDLDQYLWMIRHKTATLLATSAQLGAILATDKVELIEHYYRFGENLGLAFQIQDDILGAWGDEEVTGKSAATDIRDKKKTLPVVYVLNHPEERISAWELIDLYSQEGALDEDDIKATLALLERTGARAYAEDQAEQYHRQAMESLDKTGRPRHSSGSENAAQSALRELAASLLGRET
ncbi:MAG: polyprenyl synthetase family protein [Anaerolineae bacterium]|jgi:geranylgeranyl diphosphate synthase type I